MERGRNPHALGQSDRRRQSSTPCPPAAVSALQLRRRASRRRAGRAPRRHPAAGRRGAARTAARLRRERRRPAHLPVLAAMCLRDHKPAVLVVFDRTRRPRHDAARPGASGCSPISALAAVFSADGELIEASADARASASARPPDLTALGAEKLAREASLNGIAEGEIATGRVVAAPARRRRDHGAADYRDRASHRPDSRRLGDLRPARRPARRPDRRRRPREPGPPTRRGAPTLRFVWQMDAASRFTHRVRSSSPS